MDNVTLYILDTRKTTLAKLLEISHLSDEEQQGLEKYKALEVKKEKIVSLYFRNKYIGETYTNEFGKPLSNKVFFNISHSKGVVVLAVSENHDIGVDVEVIRNKDEDLVKYISNEEELEFIKNEFDFFSVWTSKESLVKCLGTGIRSQVKTIPGLPLNDKKEFKGELFFSKIIKNDDYIISISLKDKEDFTVDMKIEKI